MSNEKQREQGLYDARALGVPKMLVLGFQHVFAMFGATVLVPLITGLSVSTTLLMAGLGTLLFHLVTGGKVPAFLGSSFAFLGGFAIVAPKLADANGELTVPNVQMLPYACGGVVAAGLVYVLVAGLIHLFGVNRVMRFFPPVVTGPIIILIGLSLAPSAINNASTNWWLAILAMAVIIAANIWGKGMIKIIPILLGVLIPYAVALVTNQVDFSGMAAEKLVGLQPFVLAKFDLTSILVMAPIALAAMMEHIGDMSAISATVEENFIEDPGLHRTLIGDGIATSLAGMLGGPANTTYGENTGVLELSQVFDPKVVRLAAVYAVVLSFSPKFAAVINSIPVAIIGGVSFILYGMISAIGVRNVVENRVDFTNSRNLMIAAVIMVCGLGFKIWGLNNEFSGLTFHVGGTDITLTSLAIAAIAGIALNAILPGKDYQFGSDVTQGRSGDFGRY